MLPVAVHRVRYNIVADVHGIYLNFIFGGNPTTKIKKNIFQEYTLGGVLCFIEKRLK
jgi:hypothetical protein